ncbi:tRNA (guanosine(37)-N1)-methyltransferase TrmD [Deferribacter thermophilus]|uniref:tRNA (guanosine(37)-N1)-methyltransferase TrmD n=1 Tax=Deferribacter thermophilus TaxID=53573 RepID=UPI003C25E3CD
MKIFNILTIFPDMFKSPFEYGVLSKGIENGLFKVNPINLRDFAEDKHKMTDDYQYGGGAGLVMKPEPIVKAARLLKNKENSHIILLDPRGKTFNQKKAEELLNYDSLTFICGRYEGVDERVRELVVDEEISLGDFIITGGEFVAMVIIDAVARLIPGVLGDETSNKEESFLEGLLEYPHYTRPYEFEGLKVPEVLISGHHQKINEWRLEKSIKITLQNRVDLIKKSALDNVVLSRIKKMRKLYVGLMHYPMYDKEKNIVATSITNMDLHDISRSCKTFGVKNYYVINPLPAQRDIANRVLKHWQEGYGAFYNENRKEAFGVTKVKESLIEVIDEIEKLEGEKPLLVGTTARKKDNTISFDKLKSLTFEKPILLLFGTGWGFSDDMLAVCDYVLERIEGFDEFNHLSVRSAVAIILDRLNIN